MRKALFILLFLFTISNSFGQIGFGPRIGFNASAHQDVMNNGNNYILRYHAGVYAKIYFNDIIHFQPEVLFSVKGSYQKDDFIGYPDGFITTESHYKYIDVPLLFGFGNKFDFMIGLQPSFLINADQEVWYNYGTYGIDNYTVNYEGTDGLSRFDLAIVGGFQHEFDFGLNYGLRIGYGLLNISDVESIETKNFVIQLSLGYTIDM